MQITVKPLKSLFSLSKNYNILFFSPYRFMRLCAFGALLFVLSACTAQLRSSVSTFRTQASLPTQGTVRVLPAPDANLEELEFAYYQTKVEQLLQKRGYTPVDVDTSEMVVFVNYGLTRQASDTRDSDLHVHGGLAYRRPFGGVVVSGPQVERYEYVRFLQLSFAQQQVAGQAQSKLLTVKAVSTGRCQHLASVFIDMLQTIFLNLHRESGSVVNATVARSRQCVTRG